MGKIYLSYSDYFLRVVTFLIFIMKAVFYIALSAILLGIFVSAEEGSDEITLETDVTKLDYHVCTRNNLLIILRRLTRLRNHCFGQTRIHKLRCHRRVHRLLVLVRRYRHLLALYTNRIHLYRNRYHTCRKRSFQFCVRKMAYLRRTEPKWSQYVKGDEVFYR